MRSISERIIARQAEMLNDPRVEWSEAETQEFCDLTEYHEGIYGRWAYTLVRPPWWRRLWMRAKWLVLEVLQMVAK